MVKKFQCRRIIISQFAQIIQQINIILTIDRIKIIFNKMRTLINIRIKKVSIFIFIILRNKNIVLTTFLIFLLCLIIGCQLLFTILHVSRLQKNISAKNRGNLMAVNNGISRGFSAIVLISSKLLMDKMNLYEFYGCAFLLFVLFCTYFMVRTYKESE